MCVSIEGITVKILASEFPLVMDITMKECRGESLFMGHPVDCILLASVILLLRWNAGQFVKFAFYNSMMYSFVIYQSVSS